MVSNMNYKSIQSPFGVVIDVISNQELGPETSLVWDVPVTGRTVS